MTNYYKIFFTLFIGFSILIVGLLIFGIKDSDRISTIEKRLITLSPDSLESIIIEPVNVDWKINLTLDTILIRDFREMQLFTDLLNNMNNKFKGRGIPHTWSAKLILKFKNQNDIKLIVVDAKKGICVNLTNTTGNPKYKCDGLKPIMELLANYKEVVGKEKNALQQ